MVFVGGWDSKSSFVRLRRIVRRVVIDYSKWLVVVVVHNGYRTYLQNKRIKSMPQEDYFLLTECGQRWESSGDSGTQIWLGNFHSTCPRRDASSIQWRKVVTDFSCASIDLRQLLLLG